MNNPAIASCFAASLLLSGCVTFVPDYSQDLYGKLSDVQTQLAKIQAQLATTPNAKTDYAKVEPYYVAALADTQQSLTLTQNAAAYSKGKLAAVPAQQLSAMVANCQKAIEQDRASYAASGQSGNEASNLSILEDTCSIPKNVEAMMKP